MNKNLNILDNIRNDWDHNEVKALFDLSFNDLLFKAHQHHRKNFNPNTVQISTLLSIKTGKCSEDCSYCAQSNNYNTGLKYEDLLEIELVIKEAKKAKEKGATRFCMGAAWRSPKSRDMIKITKMVEAIKNIGMETCMTLGMITNQQAKQLADCGLDYYNHNLDTSAEYYNQIITTRNYQDRLKTINHIRNNEIKVCSGGIIGLGEKENDRISLLIQLANMKKHPESIPINTLVKIKGTPLKNQKNIQVFDVIKTIAITRIMMPKSYIRLSAGREKMSDEMQAITFFAGANSIFYGEKLLTANNTSIDNDQKLFRKLGISPEEYIVNHNKIKTFDQTKKLFYNAEI